MRPEPKERLCARGHFLPGLLGPLLLGLGALLFPLSSPARAQEGRRLEDAELGPLTGSLRTYFEARASASGVDRARTELFKSLLAAREKLGGADPLGAPADLARAVWLAGRAEKRSDRPGKVEGEVFDKGRFGEQGLELAWRLPRDYDPKGSGYPLILAIPDQGERPADHLRSHWTLKDLLEGAIVVTPRMPEQSEGWTRVTLGGRPGGLSHVLTALRIASSRFAVDPDRIYLAGRGQGVAAAIAAGSYAPQTFAGIAGRAGDAGEIGPENFGNLPTWFAGGGARLTAFEASAREAGLGNCTLAPGGGEPELWNWIRQHPRRTYPSSLTLVVGDPFPTRSHWLRVSPTAPDARASASIERETNTVRIEAHGVSHATLYLNDALVDLDRPVKVIGNGVERSALFPRHLPTALDLLADGTSDAGCVYVAQQIYDLSGEAPAAVDEGPTTRDAEFRGRLEAARGKVDELWKLHEWCLENQRPDRPVLLRILQLDQGHEGARTALGHLRSSDGHWFASAAAVERHEGGQDEAVATSRGKVLYKGLWIHPDERDIARKGWTKDPATGQWLSPTDRKNESAGWVRQDLDWVAPDQAGRVADGLWRVDGEWLELDAANRRRARIDSLWAIPGGEVLLYSTADREVALRVLETMQRALDDLRLVFGAEPALPIRAAVLRDEEQYERFAIGDPDGRRPAAHAGRLHVIHSAVLAESWFPRVEGELEFRGLGICYWDPLVPYGDLYGRHSARLAAGLSYVDALDPSPKAVRKALAGGPGPEFYGAYRSEKRLPEWLRMGGAVYAERFFRDPTVDAGAEGADPWWARAWSLENVQRRGGLRPLSEVLAFELDPDDIDDGQKLLIEAGLVVAFMVDGGCEPVAGAHAELKKALVSGRLHANDLEALAEALLANEAALRTFAGM